MHRDTVQREKTAPGLAQSVNDAQGAASNVLDKRSGDAHTRRLEQNPLAQ